MFCGEDHHWGAQVPRIDFMIAGGGGGVSVIEIKYELPRGLGLCHVKNIYISTLNCVQ